MRNIKYGLINFIDNIFAILFFFIVVFFCYALDPGFFKTIFIIWLVVMILSLFFKIATHEKPYSPKPRTLGESLKNYEIYRVGAKPYITDINVWEPGKPRKNSHDDDDEIWTNR